MKLAEILDLAELSVLDHLEREVAVPVLDGPQAQGDLIVLPAAMVPVVTVGSWAHWQPVPRHGVELVRGVAGGNPHQSASPKFKVLVPTQRRCGCRGGWWLSAITFP